MSIIKAAFCTVLSFLFLSNLNISFSEKGTESTAKTMIAEELDQKQLFNMTRKGVVAIKVNAHVTLEKYVNEKMWKGTGFIIDLEKGLIVTNAHVAGEMAVCTYEVKFGNGRTAEARLEYIDPCYDFAVLSVKKEDIPPYSIALKFSDKPLTVNTTIYCMGNSSCNEFSTYQGYIFDTSSILWLKSVAEQSFQFSGLTVPGASGSPVFNADGEVIGLLYGGKLVSGAALPVSYIKPVIKSLKAGKTFKRYFHGCILNYTSTQEALEAGSITKELSDEYEKQFPNSNNKILFVSKKLTAFEAKKNPIEAGDIIWKVEGELIGPNLYKIDDLVQKKNGKKLSVTVYRNGKKHDLEIPTHELSVDKKLKLLSFAGATFFETLDEIKINCGKSGNGVFIADSEIGSPFAEVTAPTEQSSNVRGGLFNIISIDGQKISCLDDLKKIIPSLFKKKVFTVRFIRMNGDSQESSITTKYSPEFANATLDTFNKQTKRWDVETIKNSSQNN